MNNTIFLTKDVRKLEKKLFTSEKEVDIDIRDSQREAEMFHFKVMSLRVHEDTKDQSECKKLFHFLFPMIKTIRREKLKNFDWDIDSKPVQRLWLSKDTKLLM